MQNTPAVVPRTGLSVRAVCMSLAVKISWPSNYQCGQWRSTVWQGIDTWLNGCPLRNNADLISEDKRLWQVMWAFCRTNSSLVSLIWNINEVSGQQAHPFSSFTSLWKCVSCDPTTAYENNTNWRQVRLISLSLTIDNVLKERQPRRHH